MECHMEHVEHIDPSVFIRYAPPPPAAPPSTLGPTLVWGGTGGSKGFRSAPKAPEKSFCLMRGLQTVSLHSAVLEESNESFFFFLRKTFCPHFCGIKMINALQFDTDIHMLGSPWTGMFWKERGTGQVSRRG